MYYFHADLARKILASAKKGETSLALSLDLNRSVGQATLDKTCLVLDRGQTVKLEDLAPIAQTPNKIFMLKAGRLQPLEIRADGYYKLVPTKTVPILEINGIRMHRSTDIDPLEDAILKARAVVIPGCQVLDTCGGLGYSALMALKAGAGAVLSWEKSPWVIQLRNCNPWLKIRNQSALTLFPGDITKEIHTLDSNIFGGVIHDPPRFCSATGDLYSRAFYTELFRVMQPRATLFHYTGSPGRVNHPDRFIKNTINRLSQAGFTRARFDTQLQGILTRKEINQP